MTEMIGTQVKALEKELIKRADEQGLDVQPQIVVVTRSSFTSEHSLFEYPRPSADAEARIRDHSISPISKSQLVKLTAICVGSRLIPEAQGTTCNQKIEKIEDTKWARILRVPFKEDSGEILQHWVSR